MLCGYGCGGEALFPPGKRRSKHCCSESFQNCPAIKKKKYTKERNEKISEARKKQWNDPNSVYNNG
jgi:hypothetical protein